MKDNKEIADNHALSIATWESFQLLQCIERAEIINASSL